MCLTETSSSNVWDSALRQGAGKSTQWSDFRCENSSRTFS